MRPGQAFLEDERVVMVAWQNVGIVCWRNAPEAEHMRQLGVFSEQLHRAHPEGYGFVNVVVSGTPNFSAEVRAEGKRVVEMTQGWDYATAHVILLQGFLASAVRAFLSTLLLVSRATRGTRVFGELAEALAFVHGRMGEAAPDLGALTAEVERLVGPRPE